MWIAKIQINFNFPMLLTEMQQKTIIFCHFLIKNALFSVFL